jgi:hypothetical protein
MTHVSQNFIRSSWDPINMPPKQGRDNVSRAGLVFLVCSHVKWVPCHHNMAHPKVADGGRKPPDMESSYEYIE